MPTTIDKYTHEAVAVGRRKRATARVRIKPGNGLFIVNGKPVEEHLCRETLIRLAKRPFDVTGNKDKYDVRARCDGGGLTGHAGALQLGVARALVKSDPNLQSTLRTAGMLTRDPREVERKKYGRPGARKRFQFSKR